MKVIDEDSESVWVKAEKGDIIQREMAMMAIGKNKRVILGEFVKTPEEAMQEFTPEEVRKAISVLETEEAELEKERRKKIKEIERLEKLLKLLEDKIFKDSPK